MGNDSRITQQDIDNASVRLVPVFGIQPERYVTVFAGIALLALLYAILLLPALVHPGMDVTFTADPPGSAVFVDGVYQDSTPCTVFVRDGTHDIVVEYPGFNPHRATLPVKGQKFATIVRRPVLDISVRLDASDVARTLSGGIRSYSSWALSGTPSEFYQIPMILSETARAFSGAGVPEWRPEGFAGAMLSRATSSQSARDAVRASAILYGGSAAVTGVGLGAAAGEFLREAAADPGLILHLASIMTGQQADRLKATPLYARAGQDLATAAETGEKLRPSTRRERIAGLDMVTFEKAIAVIRQPGAAPAAIETAGFSLAAAEVTVGEWRRFVAARPDWGLTAKASLVVSGLVDQDYMKDFDTAADGEPVRYISRYAAEAYCAWLSGNAPDGYRFALPTEAQWDVAVQAAGQSAVSIAALAGRVDGPVAPGQLPVDDAGFRGLVGNLWEWCSGSWSTHPAAGVAGSGRYPSHEAIVRGASYANRADLITPDTRGPLPAYRCTAYTGFRVSLSTSKD